MRKLDEISEEKAVLYEGDGNDFRVLKNLTTQKVIDDHSNRIYNVGDILWLLENNPNLESFGARFSSIRENDKENEYFLNVLEKNFKIYRLQCFIGWFDDKKIAKILLRNIQIRYYAGEKALQLLLIRKYRCNYANMVKLSGEALLFSWVPKELVLQMARELYAVVFQEQCDLHNTKI